MVDRQTDVAYRQTENHGSVTVIFNLRLTANASTKVNARKIFNL